MEHRKDSARIARQRELRINEIRNQSSQKRAKTIDSGPNSDRISVLSRANGIKREQLAGFVRESKGEGTYSPDINATSTALVKHLRNPNEQIEDRLLRLGKQLKAVKQSKETGGNKDKPNRGGMEVTERLLEYQHIYRDHKMMLRHQIVGSMTWKLDINDVSRRLAEGKKRDLSSPKQHRASSLSAEQFPFKPTPNKASLLLAQHLPSSSQSRLLSPRHVPITPSLTPQCTFQPVTNPAKPSKSAPGPALARWESLYNLNLKSLEARAKLRYEAQEKEDSISQFPFRPVVIQSPNASTEPVVARLLSWGDTRRGKLKQAKDRRKKERLEECTFSPTV